MACRLAEAVTRRDIRLLLLGCLVLIKSRKKQMTMSAADREAALALLDADALAYQAEMLYKRQQAGRQGNNLSASVTLPKLYPLQQQIKDEAVRFNVPCIGRRAGKTFLCTNLVLETALAGYPVGWFVPDYKVALEVWRDIVRPIKQIATKINATERRIELPNGGVIEVWTLENEDAGRGRKYKRVVIDEAASAPRLKIAWQEAISPTLIDLEGDAWFPSTPKGLNFFYELFGFGLDTLRPDWKSWQLPSTVNPFLPPGAIEAARLELPEATFKQEYLAEFLSSEGAVFRNVSACLTAPPSSPAQHVGHLIIGGLDWARQYDFTCLSLYCCKCNQEVLLDRFNQIGWELQRGRVLEQCQKWGVKYVMVETNSIGSPLLERINQEAPGELYFIGFETTAKSKPPLIQSLALSLEREQSRWLPDAVGRMELISYEAKLSASGHISYNATEGRHDDTVIARALVWRRAKAEIAVPPSIAEQVAEAIPFSARLATLRAAAPDGVIPPEQQLLHQHFRARAQAQITARETAQWGERYAEIRANEWT